MAYTANSLKSRFLSRTYVHDPADATVATKIAWVAMGARFLAKAALVSGTGILTFKIFAATDSSGTSPTVVASHSAPTDADAAGDQLVLEVDAAQVQAALAGATHVSVEMDCDANTDIVAVDYLIEPYRQYDALTADVIA
jgi:hypothetical protein